MSKRIFKRTRNVFSKMFSININSGWFGIGFTKNIFN